MLLANRSCSSLACFLFGAVLRGGGVGGVVKKKNTLNMSDAARRAAVGTGTIPGFLMRDGINCADGAPMLKA